MNFVKKILIQLVVFLHLGSIIFLIFGCLLAQSFLWLHIVAVPLVMLQWWVNGDRCVLTQIQYWLEGRPIPTGEGGTFIKSLFSRIGLSPSRTHMLLLIYGVFLGSGSISAIRLWT